MSAKDLYHSNWVICAIHCARKGSGGRMRKEVTISDPIPAKVERRASRPSGSVATRDSPRSEDPSVVPASDLGGTNWSRSMRVRLAGGMMHGRFSGLAKKRNTRLSGNG